MRRPHKIKILNTATEFNRRQQGRKILTMVTGLNMRRPHDRAAWCPEGRQR